MIKNRFSFEIDVWNLDPLTRVFAPELKLKAPFRLSGIYKPADNNIWLETDIPHILYKEQGVDQLALRLSGDESGLSMSLKAEAVHLAENLSVYQFSARSGGENDRFNLDLNWYGDKDGKQKSQFIANSLFSIGLSGKPHLDVNILPSSIYISDSLWNINESLVQIDTSSIRFVGTQLSHKDQHLLLDGTIARDENESITAKLSNIELKTFDFILGESPFFGNINGTVKVSNIYGLNRLNMDLRIEKLFFGNGELGELIFASDWINDLEKLFTEIYLVKDNSIVASSTGYIDPKTSMLDLDLMFDRTSISILEVFMPETFNKQTGYAEGKVKLSGKTDHLLLNGTIYPVGPIALGLTYLNTVYRTNDPIIFSNDSIIFPNMKVWDELGNTGYFSGHIKHRSFLDMVYDLNLTTDKILVLNTNYSQNEYFYGTILVSGSAKITGTDDDMLLMGTARSARGTQINIPFETPQNAISHNFIQFVSKGISPTEERVYDFVNQGMTMNFDLEVTPDAKVQLIINSQMGDVIRGEGSGNLNIKVDKNYNIELYGTTRSERRVITCLSQNIEN
jgi:hypothetical protein